MSSQGEHDELASTVVTKDEQQGLVDAVIPGHLQLVVFGNGTFATHALPDGASLTIGRSNRCEIAIDQESISRRHAIVHVGKTVTIEDLGSANGTRVRGNKIEPGRAVTIDVGELVGIGSASLILQQRSRPLTRTRTLWTHEYFEARVHEECAREQRSGAAFALVHISVDHRAPPAFVEETLSELVRDCDVIGKYGPHEYELLLPDTAPAQADEATRRLEDRLVERGLKLRITVACCPRDGRSPYQLAAKVKSPPVTSNTKASASSDIVVSDAQMQNLHRLVGQVAGSQIGVLLLGETGVGKEVFARAIHRASQRAAGPFVELNCAALTETLLESELFGHEKGAFTNAATAKPGLIETADGGTLLLDEIGDMPLSTQAKLLRVIEDSQLRRVGALKPRPIDVRFVAATNSDLEEQIARGAFRRDLFFRLNGVTIVIPPLRERLAELEPLAKTFVSRAARPGAPPPTLTPQALELMMGYNWPGNVRELKNMMERAVLLCEGGPIRPMHLPAEKMRVRPTGAYPRLSVGDPRDVVVPLPRKGSAEELQWIMQALDRAGGNQTLAARRLGISRRTLVNRLNEHKQIQRPRKDKPT